MHNETQDDEGRRPWKAVHISYLHIYVFHDCESQHESRTNAIERINSKRHREGKIPVHIMRT